jgi:hypothetical protein
MRRSPPELQTGDRKRCVADSSVLEFEQLATLGVFNNLELLRIGQKRRRRRSFLTGASGCFATGMKRASSRLLAIPSRICGTCGESAFVSSGAFPCSRRYGIVPNPRSPEALMVADVEHYSLTSVSGALDSAGEALGCPESRLQDPPTGVRMHVIPVVFGSGRHLRLHPAVLGRVLSRCCKRSIGRQRSAVPRVAGMFAQEPPPHFDVAR